MHYGLVCVYKSACVCVCARARVCVHIYASLFIRPDQTVDIVDAREGIFVANCQHFDKRAQMREKKLLFVLMEKAQILNLRIITKFI